MDTKILDVRGSVHYSTVHKKFNKMQQYQILLVHIYMKLNMFRATHLPSSGAQTVLASSGFAYVEGCWTCGCWTLSAFSNHTSNNLPRMQNQRMLVQFRLLMMGGVSPETCWALYKYGLIKFDILLHLVGFFYEHHNSYSSRNMIWVFEWWEIR